MNGSTAGVFCLIAGGGTAGHLHPGLSVANELVARGHAPDSILFVGSERGIETELVPAAGFALRTLPGRGIERKFSKAAATAAMGLTKAARIGRRIIASERPAVVLSLGGYASVPCGLGAVAHRVPIVVTEQNAVPGAANRLIGRFAKACAVSFPGTALPRAVLTGNPVREAILAVRRPDDTAAARRGLDIPLDRTMMVAFGGSLGALRINKAVLDAAKQWRDRPDLALYHIIGARDWDALADSRAEVEGGELLYRPVRYEEHMPLVLAAADLAVCRAGASTVAELAVVGIPSVLVPLPGAPGDHQTANARALTDVGAAVLVVDGELDGDRLAREVQALTTDGEKLGKMGEAAQKAGHRDAAARVADLVEEHARES